MKIAELGIVFGLIAACFIGNVRAADMPINCADIRAVVAMIGEKTAEQRARAAGASEEKIAEAKRCLRSKSSTGETK